MVGKTQTLVQIQLPNQKQLSAALRELLPFPLHYSSLRGQNNLRTESFLCSRPCALEPLISLHSLHRHIHHLSWVLLKYLAWGRVGAAGLTQMEFGFYKSKFGCFQATSRFSLSRYLFLSGGRCVM